MERPAQGPLIGSPGDNSMMTPRLLLATGLATGLVTGLAAPALAQDASYALVNDTDFTVMELYASPVDMAVWGEDMLGAGVIGPGETGTVTIAGGGALCAYDLRFVFDDGQELLDSVNVCEAPSYTLVR